MSRTFSGHYAEQLSEIMNIYWPFRTPFSRQFIALQWTLSLFFHRRCPEIGCKYRESCPEILKDVWGNVNGMGIVLVFLMHAVQKLGANIRKAARKFWNNCWKMSGFSGGNCPCFFIDMSIVQHGPHSYFFLDTENRKFRTIVETFITLRPP